MQSRPWWDFLRRWPYTFGVALSLVVGIFTIIMSQNLGVPLRDPEGFLGPAYIRLPLMGLAFFAAGVIPMAIKRRGVRHLVPGIRDVVRDDWTWGRVVHILIGLLTFYACYVSYRNLKSYLPVLREGVLYDKMLSEWDYWMLFGHQPGELLHQLLGTGFNAQLLSTIYLSYLMLIPITLAAFLVLNRDVSLGAWYATALALNWILGTVSYYIWPSLGPAFYQPQFFSDLEETGVTGLQQSLFRNGSAFKEDPTGAYIYGIAGFASLHVSVTFTAALFFQRTDQNRFIQAAGWIYFVLTVIATMYFGWHYIADDVAGVFIGWFAVALGGWVTGNGFWRQRHHKVQLTA
ncbi:phosphatase PAP2 family protein [Aeromicrobium phragmitis]|uniref:phosphatase PAP2 family protein n=1 Tax=Aeromicrobium phragmitis TaxID=2478914 RepID=UPI001FB77B4B|nr:phosphatase PAP2 family protein [Aeromicrobium phragmitis]